MYWYLFQGPELLEKAGGLHEFMQWDRALLTVSDHKSTTCYRSTTVFQCNLRLLYLVYNTNTNISLVPKFRCYNVRIFLGCFLITYHYLFSCFYHNLLGKLETQINRISSLKQSNLFLGFTVNKCIRQNYISKIQDDVIMHEYGISVHYIWL